jgi:hypothetical protein
MKTAKWAPQVSGPQSKGLKGEAFAVIRLRRLNRNAFRHTNTGEDARACMLSADL